MYSVSFRNCSNSYLDELYLIAQYTPCTVIILLLTNIYGRTKGFLEKIIAKSDSQRVFHTVIHFNEATTCITREHILIP